jgi:molybdopterin converting factor small subunit
MKLRIDANFVIPGLMNGSIEIDEASTVRRLLESISELSGKMLVFFERGQDTLDFEGWQVDLNGTPYEAIAAGLDTPLMKGDVVAIRLLPLTGG